MKIYFLLEALRFNYGVDRTVVELANKLSNDHEVSIITAKMESEEAKFQNVKVYELGFPEEKSLRQIDRILSRTAMRLIERLESETTEKVVIISNGWPFISIPMEKSEIQDFETLFIDYGCVPIENWNREVQLNLRELRSLFVDQYSKVVAISDFIWFSETKRLCCNREKNVLPLGVDHVLSNKLKTFDLRNQVFFLGRYEKGYKGAEEFRDLLYLLRRSNADIQGVHAGPALPDDPDYIVSLGLLDTQEMVNEIQRSRYAVSLSKWEGFNLPLAESEILGTPTFCYAIGAHSEVIREKSHLCTSVDEMAEKILNCRCLVSSEPSRWTWDKSAESLLMLISQSSRKSARLPILFIDVTNSIRDSGNSGVIRVTRQLSRTLLHNSSLDLIPLEHIGVDYRVPPDLGYLSSNNGPKFYNSALWQKYRGSSISDVILDLTENWPVAEVDFGYVQTEVYFDNLCLSRIANLPLEIESKLLYIHDLIPLHFGSMVSDDVRNGFSNYLQSRSLFKIIGCSTQYQKDLISDLPTIAEDIHVVPYGVESNAILPTEDLLNSGKRSVRGLMVSTIEPRKGHLRVIEAVAKVNRNRDPKEMIQLTLIGNTYAGAEVFQKEFESKLIAFPWIRYLGNVQDDQLRLEISNSDFMLYGSMIEGFGLPILESVVARKNIIIQKAECFSHFQNYPYVHSINFENGELEKLLELIVEDRAIFEKMMGAHPFLSLEQVRDLHSWDNFGKNLMELLFPNQVIKFDSRIKNESRSNEEGIWIARRERLATSTRLRRRFFRSFAGVNLLSLLERLNRAALSSFVPTAIKLKIYSYLTHWRR
jgi:glycosyltransferase involved in cell wall biosynthesis